MQRTQRKSDLFRALQAMSVVPLLMLGIVITAFSYYALRHAMHAQIRTELKNTVNLVILMYDNLYPGDYHLEGTEALTFYKGEQDLTGDYDLIDQIQAKTETELTIFYQDTRILTTLRDTGGMRIIGTGANSRVITDVLENGQSRFYTNTTINGELYFAYYVPLCNSDGSIVGMAYAGKPCVKVNATVREAVLPIILIALCSMLIVSLICSTFTRKLTVRLQKIRVFLARVSSGNLREDLDGSVLKKRDELSEIGYSALHMQRSIRTLIEQDTLTELNNRRSGEKRLKQTQSQADEQGTSFVVGIGDIDFFKSVNDTYGHEGGDVVLKQVADSLKQSMFGKGFVARWGGEEFLFIYDNHTLEKAYEATGLMLDGIRALEIMYNDLLIRVTMSFGLAAGGSGSDIKELLKDADANLYYAKEHGRNQVVTDKISHPAPDEA